MNRFFISAVFTLFSFTAHAQTLIDLPGVPVNTLAKILERDDFKEVLATGPGLIGAALADPSVQTALKEVILNGYSFGIKFESIPGTKEENLALPVNEWQVS